MDKDYLKLFYEQEVLREVVKQFFFDTLDEEVLKRAYKEGDVEGYKEAREVIKQVFIKLNQEYAKEKSKQKENPAR